MALLNRKVDYAIVVLSYLHHHTEGGSAREIAAQFGLSRPFVANILKELCHKGFVTSHRGVKGGYVLQQPADERNLIELIEAMDESFRLVQCNQSLPDDGCEMYSRCPVSGPITAVHNRIRDVLRDVKLTELFRPVEAASELVSLGVA